MIDVQNFYFGENGLYNVIETSINDQKIQEAFRRMGILIIHIIHKVNSKDSFIEEIHESVKPLDSEIGILFKRDQFARYSQRK